MDFDYWEASSKFVTLGLILVNIIVRLLNR